MKNMFCKCTSAVILAFFSVTIKSSEELFVVPECDEDHDGIFCVFQALARLRVSPQQLGHFVRGS